MSMFGGRDKKNKRVPSGSNIAAATLQLSRLSEWSPQEVAAYFTQKLNMPPQYGEMVESNHITGLDIIDIVREQNYEQLKEIGIVAVGLRNRIFREFASHADTRNGQMHDSGTERKTQEKTKRDMILEENAYGPLWQENFPGVPLTQTIQDQRFFEFFARTRVNYNHQREIWMRCVGEKHSCNFNEFVTMMKMTIYVQMGAPPSVLSVQALHTDHPTGTVDLGGSRPPPSYTHPRDVGSSTSGSKLTTIPPSAAAAAGSSSVTDFRAYTHPNDNNNVGKGPGGGSGMLPPSPIPEPRPGIEQQRIGQTGGGSQRDARGNGKLMSHIMAQAQHNVLFRNLPQEVLDSDDKLYSLESLALHVFNPIHFEIDGETLIATFDNDITPPILSQIRDKTIQALLSMGIEAFKVHRVGLSIPPPPQDEDVAIFEGSFVTPDGSEQPRGGYTGSNGSVPPPPPPPSQGSGANPTQFYHEFMRKVNLDAEFQNIRDGKLRTMNVMNILAKLRGVGSSKDVKFNDVAIKELSNLNRQRLEMYLRNITPQQIDILMGRGGGSTNALPQAGGRRDASNPMMRTEPPQTSAVTSYSSRSTGPSNNHGSGVDPDSREQFVGVVISGLPETITENDDSLLQLDAIVLNDVTVEHIEVVGTTLRITFGEMIAKATLTNMRKSLRDFLFDNGLQKREVKNVTIAPHTLKTWKGRVTEEMSSNPPVAYGQPQAQEYHQSALAQQPFQKPYPY